MHGSMNIVDDPSANFPNCVSNKSPAVDGEHVAKSSGADTHDNLESMKTHADSVVPVPPMHVRTLTFGHVSASFLDSGPVQTATTPSPPRSPNESSPLEPRVDSRVDFIPISSVPTSPGVSKRGENTASVPASEGVIQQQVQAPDQ
jgi:hypothetical protein